MIPGGKIMSDSIAMKRFEIVVGIEQLGSVAELLKDLEYADILLSRV